MKNIFFLLLAIIQLSSIYGQSNNKKDDNRYLRNKILISNNRIFYVNGYSDDKDNTISLVIKNFGSTKLLSEYRCNFIENQYQKLSHNPLSWDIASDNIIGVAEVGIAYDALMVYGFYSTVLKTPIKDIQLWNTDTTFNYSLDSYKVSRILPIRNWFVKKYGDDILKKRRQEVPYEGAAQLMPKVLPNTYFDMIVSEKDKDIFFYALLEDNILSTWSYDKSKWKKIREYSFSTKGYFSLVVHKGKKYLIAFDGTVYSLNSSKLQIVKTLPTTIDKGLLLIDKDNEQIYFVQKEQFEDKTTDYSQLKKNGFRIF